jgi:single-stranded DNA-binding protein
MDIRIIDGRLTKDAEVRTNKNVKFLSFAVANNKFANGVQTTTYFNVISFDEYLIKRHEEEGFLSKGKAVTVIGEPHEEMVRKEPNIYLNRKIKAYRVESSTFDSLKPGSDKVTVYKDVAPDNSYNAVVNDSTQHSLQPNVPQASPQTDTFSFTPMMNENEIPPVAQVASSTVQPATSSTVQQVRQAAPVDPITQLANTYGMADDDLPF